ncbi:MAG: hypothetical protein Q7R93_01565 [bacterium]|nr:hypothetical protein [bacterium]
MLHFITKLQRKPERVRKQMALIVAASVTGVIALIWVVNVSLGGGLAAEASVVKATSGTGPFQSFMSTIEEVFDDTKQVVSDIKTVFSGRETATAAVGFSTSTAPASKTGAQGF